MTDRVDHPRTLAKQYIDQHSLVSLFESLCEQVLLEKPANPVAFLSTLLAKQTGAPVPVAAPTATSLQVPAAASSSTVSSTPSPRSAAAASASAAVIHSALDEFDAHTLRDLILANQKIANTLDPYTATHVIIDETCRLCNCDRATLFTLDDTKNELQMRVAKGAANVFLPLGKGIAGTVAQNGEAINVPDAYLDSRFDQTNDQKTGYRTKTILAVPIKDFDSGSIIGVLQCINKKDGSFNTRDVYILENLGLQCGITIRNSLLFEIAISSKRKSQALLEIVKALHAVDLNVTSLMFIVTERIHSLVEADRCTFFLVDYGSQELWSMQGNINLRIPLSKGIAAHCARTGEAVNIPDAYQDSRFDPNTDKKTNYKTQSILCMPMMGENSKVLGVLQLINRKDGSPFDDGDEEILRLFLGVAGPILERSNLYESLHSRSTGGSGKDEAVVARSPAQHRSSRPLNQLPAGVAAAIAEEDARDEEEEEAAAAAAAASTADVADVAPAPAADS